MTIIILAQLLDLLTIFKWGSSAFFLFLSTFEN